MSDTVYKSKIGLEVFKSHGSGYTISGNANPDYTMREFDGAYEFEECIQNNISCKGIEFDSEYCQFFAYAKTKQTAIAFVKRIEKHFEKVSKLLS
jgi:hypothetical protein